MGDTQSPLRGLCRPKEVQQFVGLGLPPRGLLWDLFQGSEMNNPPIHPLFPGHYLHSIGIMLSTDRHCLSSGPPNAKEMFSIPGGKAHLMTYKPMFLRSGLPASQPILPGPAESWEVPRVRQVGNMPPQELSLTSKGSPVRVHVPHVGTITFFAFTVHVFPIARSTV